MVDIIVGGQYGSEGKGVIAARMAREYDCHVRVGGPNAGHSFVHEGRLWKMQAVPCGWINPTADLVIGPGGVVALDVLEKEISEIEVAGYKVRNRIYIDGKAGVLEPGHAAEEDHTGGEMHQRIGSTGEGIGACRRDRLMRNPEKFTNFYGLLEAGRAPEWMNGRVVDTTYRVKVKKTLIEGTQGFGLSLIHGQWPYVTSDDTTAGSIAAQCGVGPKNLGRIIMVVRAMPIRVAGNSGPMLGEVSWDDMSRKLGRNVEERTTVTKKVRRIGEWDWSLFYQAVQANTPTDIVLTFADYMDPRNHNVREFERLSLNTRQLVDTMERYATVPLVGTGFDEKEGWVCCERS